VNNEALTVAAMSISNPDHSPIGINSGDTAPTPTGLAEICQQPVPSTSLADSAFSRSIEQSQNDMNGRNDAHDVGRKEFRYARRRKVDGISGTGIGDSF